MISNAGTGQRRDRHRHQRGRRLHRGEHERGRPGRARPVRGARPALGSPLAAAQASNEPLDATDLRLFSNDGVQIPARPRSTTNGIVFQSPGAKNFYDTHRKVVSYLGEHWNEDQLQWNHGESQQEHEFAEGYLEFEMFDSQLFARIGKQLVIWGKTELFRNQDRNNPLDIGNGIFGPLDEARVGQWALDVTLSPEAFMRVGPVEDLRLELLWIMNQFTPTDLGKCGEGASVELICLKSFGAMARGLAGIGLLGETRPTKDFHGLGDLRLRRARRRPLRPLHVLGLRLLGLRRRLHPRYPAAVPAHRGLHDGRAARDPADEGRRALQDPHERRGSARRARTASRATATTTSRARATACSGTSPDDRTGSSTCAHRKRSPRCSRSTRPCSTRSAPSPSTRTRATAPSTASTTPTRSTSSPRSSAASASSAASFSTAPRRSTSRAARSRTSIHPSSSANAFQAFQFMAREPEGRAEPPPRRTWA